MPLIETIAMASLAAAGLSDFEEPKSTTYWLVVFVKIQQGISVRESPGGPPIKVAPNNPVLHEDDCLVLQMTAPPGTPYRAFESALLEWYYETYEPEYLKALAAYRRRRTPWQIKDLIGSQNLEELDDLDFLMTSDWPESTQASMKVLAALEGGRWVWDHEDRVSTPSFTRAEVVRLVLGQDRWAVVSCLDNVWDVDNPAILSVIEAPSLHRALKEAARMTSAKGNKFRPLVVFLGVDRVVKS